MAPEYAMEGLFSMKSDTYSFGVLLLEILSGKKNSGFHHPDHSQNLLSHVGFSSTIYIPQIWYKVTFFSHSWIPELWCWAGMAAMEWRQGTWVHRSEFSWQLSCKCGSQMDPYRIIVCSGRPQWQTPHVIGCSHAWKWDSKSSYTSSSPILCGKILHLWSIFNNRNRNRNRLSQIG